MGARLSTLLTSRVGAVLVLLGAVLLAGLAFSTSPSQPAATATTGLPAGKQSTEVAGLADRFPSGRQSAAVVVYERTGGALTDADRAAVEAARSRLDPRALDGQVTPAVLAPDGRAALVTVALPPESATGGENVDAVKAIRADVRRGLPSGLTAQVTGPAAFSTDISAAFDGADVTLLVATALVVAVLLLVTYRSPVLWVVPLVVIGLGEQATAQLLPWVGRLLGSPTDAAVGGIVSVLVFGAGTDYALLLISRYREELRRYASRREAMAVSVRAVAPAVLGSATTVVLALLSLLAATLTSNRTLGVASALGIVVALVVGLLVLPAALVCLGRWVFWPFVPRVGSPDTSESGVWARIARTVGRRPGRVLVASVVVLGALTAGLVETNVGLSQTEQFRTKVESVTAQEALARHFPAGASQPATVIAAAATTDAVVAATKASPGVAEVGRPERSDDARLVQLPVDLRDGSGTPGADTAVTTLRERLAAVPGAQALVGGAPASDLDAREANRRDDRVVVPVVLAIVLLVLVVLLRSLLAPVLLVVTVVATFAASLGAATLVLRALFDQQSLDAGVPLLAFLFLVALGVDYNIFLATRAREETQARGDTRAGMLTALSVTGGVITSAGILLAAVFTVLGVLPVIVLTQIGVIVGIGVLLDTLLVRTLVVPALAVLLGERFWWPAPPAAEAVPASEKGKEVLAGHP